MLEPGACPVECCSVAHTAMVRLIVRQSLGCRKLLLWSLVGVTAAMLFLGGAFRLAETHSPPVALDNECSAFEGNTCTECIRQVCPRSVITSRLDLTMCLCNYTV